MEVSQTCKDVQNFLKCISVIKEVSKRTVPCIEKVITDLHVRLKAKAGQCHQNSCPKYTEPKDGVSCESCVAWAREINCLSIDINWKVVSSSKFYADPLELAKLFVCHVSKDKLDKVKAFSNFGARSLFTIIKAYLQCIRKLEGRSPKKRMAFDEVKLNMERLQVEEEEELSSSLSSDDARLGELLPEDNMDMNSSTSSDDARKEERETQTLSENVYTKEQECIESVQKVLEISADFVDHAFDLKAKDQKLDNCCRAFTHFIQCLKDLGHMTYDEFYEACAQIQKIKLSELPYDEMKDLIDEIPSVENSFRLSSSDIMDIRVKFDRFCSDADVVSDRMLNAVARTLAHADLPRLYLELGIEEQDVEKIEIATNYRDVNLKAAAVLRFWRKRNGKAATPKSILHALKNCQLFEAKAKLEDIWKITDGTQLLSSTSVSTEEENAELRSQHGLDSIPFLSLRDEIAVAIKPEELKTIQRRILSSEPFTGIHWKEVERKCIQDVKDTYDLLSILEEKLLFTPYNVVYLQTVFGCIGRDDLVKTIAKFAKRWRVLKPPFSVKHFTREPDASSMLPCEFCQEPFPPDLLIVHESGCRPDVVSVASPQRPSTNNNKQQPSHGLSVRPHVLVNLNQSPECGVPARKSSVEVDEENTVMLPCEFCGDLLPAEFLSHHQVNCTDNGTVNPAPRDHDANQTSRNLNRFSPASLPKPRPRRMLVPTSLDLNSRPLRHQADPECHFFYAALHIDGQIENTDGKFIEEYRERLARWLGLDPPCLVKFIALDEGSIIILFELPITAKEDLREAVLNSARWLVEAHVISITFDQKDTIYLGKEPGEIPGKPKAIDIDAIEINISWTTPESDGGIPIIGYTVECKTCPFLKSHWIKVNTEPVKETTLLVTGLVKRCRYQFRVIVERETVSGPASKPSDTYWTKVTYKPLPPTYLHITQVTPESVTLAWEPPNFDGGSPISKYIIERCDMKSPTWTVAGTLPCSEYTFTESKLMQGNEYQFDVSAVNKHGQSEPAKITVVPEKPIDLRDLQKQLKNAYASLEKEQDISVLPPNVEDILEDILPLEICKNLTNAIILDSESTLNASIGSRIAYQWAIANKECSVHITNEIKGSVSEASEKKKYVLPTVRSSGSQSQGEKVMFDIKPTSTKIKSDYSFHSHDSDPDLILSNKTLSVTEKLVKQPLKQSQQLISASKNRVSFNSNLLAKFSIVFALDFRSSKSCLIDAIQKELTPSISQQNLDVLISSNSDSCLFLLKAYDNVQLHDVLANKMLAHCHVICIYQKLGMYSHVPLRLRVTHVTHFSASNYKIGDDGAKALSKESLYRMHELRHLDLSSNNIGDDGAKDLSESLKYMHELKHLDLSSNNIGDDGAKALSESLDDMYGLSHLDLSSNNIGDDGAKAFSKSLHHMFELWHLDFSSNNIRDDGAKALSESLEQMWELRHLDLSSNNIGDDGAKALSESLYHMRELGHLDLSSNNIGDDGAKALSEKSLYCMPELRHLDLSSNNIGDDGAKALSESLYRTHELRHLDLSSNNIGDHGAKALSESLHPMLDSGILIVK